MGRRVGRKRVEGCGMWGAEEKREVISWVGQGSTLGLGIIGAWASKVSQHGPLEARERSEQSAVSYVQT